MDAGSRVQHVIAGLPLFADFHAAIGYSERLRTQWDSSGLRVRSQGDALTVAPGAGGIAVVALERGGEGVGRAVADAFGDFGETQLVHPQVVAGERHSPVGEAAQILGDATGQAIYHFDLDRDTWVAGLVTNGVPDDYAEIMRALSQTIADGRAAQPTVSMPATVAVVAAVMSVRLLAPAPANPFRMPAVAMIPSFATWVQERSDSRSVTASRSQPSGA
jgi:hypothetical protein